jgi:hypothetical protein
MILGPRDNPYLACNLSRLYIGATSIKSLVLDTGITGMLSSSGLFTNPISSHISAKQ